MVPYWPPTPRRRGQEDSGSQESPEASGGGVPTGPRRCVGWQEDSGLQESSEVGFKGAQKAEVYCATDSDRRSPCGSGLYLTLPQGDFDSDALISMLRVGVSRRCVDLT